jgi:hypothetical protein
MGGGGRGLRTHTSRGEPPSPPKDSSWVEGAVQDTRIWTGDRTVRVTPWGEPGTLCPVVVLTVAEKALGPMALYAATRT